MKPSGYGQGMQNCNFNKDCFEHKYLNIYLSVFFQPIAMLWHSIAHSSSVRKYFSMLLSKLTICLFLQPSSVWKKTLGSAATINTYSSCFQQHCFPNRPCLHYIQFFTKRFKYKEAASIQKYFLNGMKQELTWLFTLYWCLIAKPTHNLYPIPHSFILPPPATYPGSSRPITAQYWASATNQSRATAFPSAHPLIDYPITPGWTPHFLSSLVSYTEIQPDNFLPSQPWLSDEPDLIAHYSFLKR